MSSLISKKAFDRVWHAALWATMRQYNSSHHWAAQWQGYKCSPDEWQHKRMVLYLAFAKAKLVCKQTLWESVTHINHVRQRHQGTCTLETNGCMDEMMNDFRFYVLRPFQQYFSHIRTMGGRQWKTVSNGTPFIIEKSSTSGRIRTRDWAAWAPSNKVRQIKSIYSENP